MDYRIERKEAFRVVGVSMPLEAEVEKNFQTVPAFWNRAAREGTVARLCEKMNAQPMGVLGLSICDPGAQDMRYYIAVASTAPAGELEAYTVPAQTFAIFSGAGTGLSIQELERRVVTQWLPTSGYEYANGPDIEVYLDPDPANTKYEVWIPVRKA